jgi:Tol biopolymer transport system component
LIVFDMQDNVSRQIWQVAIDGGDLVQLTATGPDNQHPSRVGNKLVYAGARNGRTFDLFMVNLSNNSETQITNTASAAERDPYLSPNGNRLVYVSDATGLDRAIYANADGTGAAFVTDNSSNTGAIEITPSWSPGSDKVVLSSTAFNGSPDIYVQSNLGAGATRLPVAVNTIEAEATPVWNSANVIAFLTTRTGDTQIWTTDPAGSSATFLVAGGMPAWLPDGRLVFVRFSSSGKGSLFWIDLSDKSVVHAIDVGGGNAQRPSAVLP